MNDAERVERLLQMALSPVEPPERLTDRLERGLSELTEAAAEELADWELAAMSDPRNWVRPAAAVVVGSIAAGGLVLVRARQQHRKRQTTGLRALENSLRAAIGALSRGGRRPQWSRPRRTRGLKRWQGRPAPPRPSAPTPAACASSRRSSRRPGCPTA